jgi:hypothetical protein
MEDKITSKSINDIKDFIINHSIRNFNNEICGFIGFDEIEKCFDHIENKRLLVKECDDHHKFILYLESFRRSSTL